MEFDFKTFAEDTRSFIEKYYTHSVCSVTLENTDGVLVLKILGNQDSTIEIRDDGDEVLCKFFEHHWHTYKEDKFIAQDILDGIFKILSWGWASYTVYSTERLYGGGLTYGRTDDEIVDERLGTDKKATHIRLKRWGCAESERQRTNI